MKPRGASTRRRATGAGGSSDERLLHVNAVLKAIRNVNQVIVRETDQHRLLQGVCDSLIDTRGYHGAWVITLENGKPSLEASAGIKGLVKAFRARLDRGQLPECALRARRLEGVRCVRAPAKECGDCPLAVAYTGRAGLAIRLSRSDRLSGILGVSVPAAFADDAEERHLLREVADDVALALEGIALATERERAVEELRRSEERFRLAAVSVTDLVYEWDTKNTLIWYGDVDSLMGYPAGRYPRTLDAWVATLHPDDLPPVTAAIDAQLKGAAPYAIEYRLATRDGGWRWWSARGTVLRDERGEPHRWIGAVTDITDRKRAEESLARNALELGVRDRVAKVFLTVSDEAMYADVLAVVLEAMQSKFGVFGYIDEAGGLVVPTMTRTIWDRCQVADKTFVFPRDSWSDSSWPRAIREKRPILQNEPSTGTPEGHIPITRHISLPLIHQGEVVGLLQVANKDADYTDRDLALLKVIGAAIAPVLDARLKRERQEAARKRAEEELRESEARYRSLVENIPEKVFMKDREYRFASINENFARDLGIRPEDVVGKVDSDLFPKELADKYRADDTRIMETGQNEELEERYLQGGRETWVRTLKAPVRDADGAIVGICGVFSDIADRKRAEEALRVSEERFSKIFRASPIGLSITRMVDGKYIDVNEAFLGLFGYTREEALSHTSVELQTWASPAERERVTAPLQREGGLREVEALYRRKSGEVWTALVSAELIEIAGEQYVLALLQDITERKKAEANLAAAQQLYRELFDNVAIGLLRTTPGPEGAFIDVNPAMVKMFEADDSEQLMALQPSAIYWDESQRKLVSEAIVAKGLVEEDVRFKTLKGKMIWCHIKAVRRTDADGRTYFDDTIEDISERKKAEEEIRRLNAELEDRVAERTRQLEASMEELAAVNRELEAFTYSVSHDLRAPLRQADGFAKILLEDYGPKLEPQAAHYLERVRQGTRYMGQLVDELLSFSRLGRRELARQIVGLDTVLKEAIDDLKPMLEGRRIEWRLGKLPWTECDPTMIRQVFANLLSNAIKFTRPRESAIIEVGSTTADGRPEVFVRDNGVGFSMKYADKLFTVFQRLHRQEDFEGTGIGLAIVQRIIHKHGGRVWAESEVDSGATFHFTLSAVGGA